MSRALEFSIEEFREYNRANNKNLQIDAIFKPVLPNADTIYYKDFHFLDEPLINIKRLPSIAKTSSAPSDIPQPTQTVHKTASVGHIPSTAVISNKD